MHALRVGLIYSVSSNKNIFPNLEVYDLICILGTADVCSLIIWALCVYTCYVLLIVFWCFTPLNAELYPISHLLGLLGAHPNLHVSRIRVKAAQTATFISHVIITLLT